VLKNLEGIQKEFNKLATRAEAGLDRRPDRPGRQRGHRVAAKKRRRHAVEVPFSVGRTDATQDQTDVGVVRGPRAQADGFRNYYAAGDLRSSPADLLSTRRNAAQPHRVPEMTVLVGGLRVLNANAGRPSTACFTTNARRRCRTTSSSTCWTCRPSGARSKTKGMYEGLDRKTGGEVDRDPGRSGVRFERELRAVAEVYGQSDGKERFVRDFVKAWTKVTNNDRF
jgi:catalase-peroxidase